MTAPVAASALGPGHPAWVMHLFEGCPTWLRVPGAPHAKQRPRLTRGKRAYKPDKAQEAAIAWHLGSQWRGPPIQGPVALYVRFWLPDARARDLDNLVKALLDAGNQAQLWKDDRQVVSLVALKWIDRESPRTELAFGAARG